MPAGVAKTPTEGLVDRLADFGTWALQVIRREGTGASASGVWGLGVGVCRMINDLNIRSVHLPRQLEVAVGCIYVRHLAPLYCCLSQLCVVVYFTRAVDSSKTSNIVKKDL